MRHPRGAWRIPYRRSWRSRRNRSAYQGKYPRYAAGRCYNRNPSFFAGARPWAEGSASGQCGPCASPAGWVRACKM